MASTQSDLLPNEKVTLGPAAMRLKGMGLTAGVVLLGAAVVWGYLLPEESMRRFMHSYLLAFTYFLSFAVGALFFVILHHLVGATWSVTTRRIAEVLTGAFPMLFILSLGITVPLLAGSDSLYIWNNTKVVAASHMLHAKAGYLSAPFFFLRILIYFALWIGMSMYFRKKSTEQDESGDPVLSARMKKLSAPAMIVFALTTAWAAFDLLMSLMPEWFSTIFGVYYFAGSAISIYALLAIISFALQRSGRLKTAITVEHYHDLGKMTNAFTLFWAYIGFSQFMLIWAANIPEESIFYAPRMFTQWKWTSVALIVLHFCIPFVGMMSRHVKRNPPLLALWCAYMLGVHLFDLYWVILPNYNLQAIVLHPIDFLCVGGVGGLFLFAVAATAGRTRLLAVRDPRLAASLRFINQ